MSAKRNAVTVTSAAVLAAALSLVTNNPSSDGPAEIPDFVTVATANVEAGIVPSKSPQHTLVRVQSPFSDARFQDVEVITAIDNVPRYIEVVETTEPGVFVFTGPPAAYAVKTAGFYEDRGFVKRYGNTTIEGLPGPNPPPDPEPEPEPEPEPPKPDVPPDSFDNIGQKAAAWAIELQLDKTAEIAANYDEAAKRLSGELSPPLPTIDLAVAFIQQANQKVAKNDAAWREWAGKVGKHWDTHVTDRTSAAGFMAAVAVGLRGAK